MVAGNYCLVSLLSPSSSFLSCYRVVIAIPVVVTVFSCVYVFCRLGYQFWILRLVSNFINSYRIARSSSIVVVFIVSMCFLQVAAHFLDVAVAV